MSSTAGAIARTRGAGGELTVQRQLVVASRWMILGLVVGLAALLLVRRVSGAFQRPLSGLTIVAAALIAELAAYSYRQFSSRNQRCNPEYSVLSTQYSLIIDSVLPTVAAFALIIALTIPRTSLWGLVFAWLIVIAGEAAQWRFFVGPKLHHFQWRPMTPASPSPPLATDGEAEEEEAGIPDGLIQQVTRVIEDDRESIHALVKIHVAANDRLAVIHLAFCPPLTKPPELTAHALDMDEADVRITQAETFGARIEARLTTVAPTERAFMIEIFGSVTSSKSA